MYFLKPILASSGQEFHLQDMTLGRKSNFLSPKLVLQPHLNFK